jgi:tRNA uridine 5-carboxymethylaminomethyl modification enzyme
LISEERYQRFLQKQEIKYKEINRLKNTSIAPNPELNDILVSRETTPLSTGIREYTLLKRPQVDYALIARFDPDAPQLDANITEQIEVEIKYEGYIQKQLKQVEQVKKLEEKRLPLDFDYCEIKGLRLEAQEKLNKIKPLNIGQASRISGVSPADISVLLIWMATKK